MRIARGKRHSLVLTTKRSRVRLVPGRFRFGFYCVQPGIYVLAVKLVMVTLYRSHAR